MIPISKPILGEKEIQYVTDAVSSGWISSKGNYIDRFEQEFANFCGVKHCISTSNGTVAIHLALVALGVGQGDEVIVPDLTFAATANAVILAGGIPIFADVRTSDWCLDPISVRQKISSKTKAIIPVHLYGHPCEMDALKAIATEYSLFIIEDAAEAHGAEYHGQRVGSIGDCATFSFFGNKIITTGEGGCITTNSDEIAERARMLRDHGMSKERRYWHVEVGYNYRLTNIQAAIGLAQLEKINDFIHERKRIFETYKHYLSSYNFVLNPHMKDCQPVNWMTCILVPQGQRCLHLLSELKENGVDTRPFFYPLTSMPIYEGDINPIAFDLSVRGFNVPTFPGLTEEEIKYIANQLVHKESMILI